MKGHEQLREGEDVVQVDNKKFKLQKVWKNPRWLYLLEHPLDGCRVH